MYPMLINHKDVVNFVKADTFRKHDVLCRLIGTDRGGPVMCGDNEFVRERIELSQIIGVGVMSELTH